MENGSSDNGVGRIVVQRVAYGVRKLPARGDITEEHASNCVASLLPGEVCSDDGSDIRVVDPRLDKDWTSSTVVISAVKCRTAGKKYVLHHDDRVIVVRRNDLYELVAIVVTGTGRQFQPPPSSVTTYRYSVARSAPSLVNALRNTIATSALGTVALTASYAVSFSTAYTSAFSVRPR